MGYGDFERPKRDEKGKSLIEDIGDYVVVDLETTGLDPQWDSIIEIAVLIVNNGEITAHCEQLINPKCQIDDFITELTGITNEMLEDAPLAEDVFPKFFNVIGNRTVVAHNANFDINFLYDYSISMRDIPFTNNFIDTMRVSRRMFPTVNGHRLSDLVERFEISKNIEHRALSDAIVTYECYEYMKKYAVENDIPFASLYPKSFSANQIKTSNTVFNESSPIFGKVFVFTGTLDKMTRREAMQLVVDMGGSCGNGVTLSTNYLVLGNNNYCTTIKDGKSSKQKKAEKYALTGIDIQTISESVFYDMLSE